MSSSPSPAPVQQQQQEQSKVNLEHLFLSNKGIWCDHLLPLLAARDVGRLERVSSTLRRVLLSEEQGDNGDTAAPAPGISTSHGGGGKGKSSHADTVAWKKLWDRDFDRDGALSAQLSKQQAAAHDDDESSSSSTYSIKSGPVYSDQDNDDDTNNSNNNDVARARFRRFVAMASWKAVYAAWFVWSNRTQRMIQPPDMVRAAWLWNRFKGWVLAAGQKRPALRLAEQMLASLEDGLTVDELAELTTEGLLAPPSSVLAFRLVHKGQREDSHNPFIGIFGACSVYDYAISMHQASAVPNIVHFPQMLRYTHGTMLGLARPRSHMLCVGMDGSRLSIVAMLGLDFDPDGPSVMARVGDGGILSYLETFVDRLEAGMYQADCIVPTVDATGGISLFPRRRACTDLGVPAATGNDESTSGCWSCCISHGLIEVEASARWLYGNRPVPQSRQQQQPGLNFAYSVRIRLVDNDDASVTPPPWKTCQLVGRHWQFTDGRGQVQEVSGEAVIGKQPLFFRRQQRPAAGDGGVSGGTMMRSGFVDLGPAGTGERFVDRDFVYQSQTGPVAGTTPQDTGMASVRGSFTFVPGSIAQPTGPIFHVHVAPFRLTVPFPFY